VPPSRRPVVNAARRPWLEIDQERYPLVGALTVIGRDALADIVLDDPGISRRHSEVRVTNDGPHLVTSIRDLGSTNGTFVNGERITSVRLQDGDRLTVGRTAVVFHAGKR
jgi:pSer/pThr/pTyr-binding forkhead associated (FHA) protein